LEAARILETVSGPKGEAMSSFPLVCNYEGDYGMKLLVVDTSDTMDAIADQAKKALVGVVVKPPRAGSVLRVRRHGERNPLPRDLKVGDANFIRMEAVDIYQADS
jgi:toluene monooxygenase system protein B